MLDFTKRLKRGFNWASYSKQNVLPFGTLFAEQLSGFIRLAAAGLTVFLGDQKLAEAWCWAVWRRIHHEQIRAIKQRRAGQAYQPEALLPAIISRIFGAL